MIHFFVCGFVLIPVEVATSAPHFTSVMGTLWRCN